MQRVTRYPLIIKNVSPFATVWKYDVKRTAAIEKLQSDKHDFEKNIGIHLLSPKFC